MIYLILKLIEKHIYLIEHIENMNKNMNIISNFSSVIKEEDLKMIPVMHASVNEEIKARFDNIGDGLSDYTV